MNIESSPLPAAPEQRLDPPEACADCLALPEAAARLAVLGQPQRLHILRFLIRAGEAGAPVGAIQAHIAVAPSTLSHHLAQLVAADLLVQQRQGRSLICQVNFSGLRALMHYLLSECCAGLDLASTRPGATPTDANLAATGAPHR